jgi:hypothetical protein
VPPVVSGGPHWSDTLLLVMSATDRFVGADGEPTEMEKLVYKLYQNKLNKNAILILHLVTFIKMLINNIDKKQIFQ